MCTGEKLRDDFSSTPPSTKKCTGTQKTPPVHFCTGRCVLWNLRNNLSSSVACCSYTTRHCCMVYTTATHHVLRNSVYIAYATASYSNVKRAVVQSRLEAGVNYCVSSRVAGPCVYCVHYRQPPLHLKWCLIT